MPLVLIRAGQRRLQKMRLRKQHVGLEQLKRQAARQFRIQQDRIRHQPFIADYKPPLVLGIHEKGKGGCLRTCQSRRQGDDRHLRPVFCKAFLPAGNLLRRG